MLKVTGLKYSSEMSIASNISIIEDEITFEDCVDWEDMQNNFK